MTTPTTVADKTVVTFHYTLRDADGEVLDSSEGEEPLIYLHGADNIVPGLERQLVGKKVGDKLTAVVSAQEGYGEHDGEEPQKVPLSDFPEDAEIEEGMEIVAEDDDDELHPLWVVEVGDDYVLLDHNHPLAGVELHFDVEITAIRAATKEELEHGHPHGADGHEDHDA